VRVLGRDSLRLYSDPLEVRNLTEGAIYTRVLGTLVVPVVVALEVPNYFDGEGTQP